MSTRAAGALLFLFAATRAAAGSLSVEVRDAKGAPVRDAVVWAVPEERRPQPASGRTAVMDQRNRTFVPHVLAVQVGTAVRFPNSDNVRHQVYSFSPAKRFQLPLYAGTPANPVVFDKPGVVPLGCNIHDRMSAYVVVVDTPWFAVTDSGPAELPSLPEGRYLVRVWHERQRASPEPQAVSIGAAERRSLVFTLGRR